MSIQKTKAELAIAQHYQDIADRLPGSDVLGEARRAAIEAFNENGLPHRRIEAWKYTDLRTAMKSGFAPALGDRADASWQALEVALGPLAGLDAARLVLVDGAYSAELSSLDTLGEGVVAKPLSAALADPAFVDEQGGLFDIEPDHSVVALNTAFMTDGAAVQIEAAPERALHIIHVATGRREQMISTRNLVYVAAGVEATIVESFVAFEAAAAQINALTRISVADGATVHHIKVQRDNLASSHLSTWIVDLGAEADYRGFQFSSGAILARNQVALKFNGNDAKADISGVNLIRGRQHCDTTMVIDHAMPGCQSRELFKLVLDDEARGVFQGKVIVRPDAQKTDGKQMAQALMLSEACEFDSKPELEIYADDVACGHGATCAEIDPDLVFYCRSRGIPVSEAKALITLSFAAESIEKVEDEAIAAALTALTEAWLAEAGHPQGAKT